MQEPHVEIDVVAHDHRAAQGPDDIAGDLTEHRRSKQHPVGDAMARARLWAHRHGRSHKGLVLTLWFAELSSDDRHLADAVTIGRQAGHLEVEHRHRDLPQRAPEQRVDAHFLGADRAPKRGWGATGAPGGGGPFRPRTSIGRTASSGKKLYQVGGSCLTSIFFLLATVA